MTDGLGVAVLHCKLLLGSRLLGLKDKDGLLDFRELDIVKGGKRTEAIEDSFVFGLEVLFHLALDRIRVGNVDTGFAVGKTILIFLGAREKFVHGDFQGPCQIRKDLDVRICLSVLPF